jgi:hypothetical protein
MLAFFLFGVVFAEWNLSSKEGTPTGEYWYGKFLGSPRYHWIASYIFEGSDTFVRFQPEYYKKDNLAQAIDRILTEGIEQDELDSLSWLVLGTHFTARRDEEFANLCNHMAHLVDHKTIGGNSL